MARTSGFELVERIVGPRLRELLSDTSISFDQAADILRDEYEIRRNGETLRLWAGQIGLPNRSKLDDETADVAS